MKNLGIYIHIPFCLRKCPYCDFYSTANHDGELRKGFVRALCREIEEAGKRYGKKDARVADTIYFGGGTPSLLSPEELEAVLAALRDNFAVAGDAEISMECNPATASFEKLAAYRSMGVNRLSVGAQSFDDGVLGALGRVHGSADTLRTVRDARRAGFDNLSLDLMFAVPNQTHEIWEATVKRAVELKPEHLSFYSLEFMEGTPFAERLKRGEIRETEAEDDRRMYERGLEIMAGGGFTQYEISNASRGAEYVCRHNMKYWSLEEYLGLGPSAHSYMIDGAGKVSKTGKETGRTGRGVRFSNACSVEKYFEAAEKGESASGAFTENSLADDVCEYIFTGLRKNEGIDLEDFHGRFGGGIWEFYGNHVRKDFEEYVKGGFAAENDENIRLTVKGMNVSNRIMALFV